MIASIDPRMLEALSSTGDTSGLRKLLVVLSIRKSVLEQNLVPPQSCDLPSKSVSSKIQSSAGVTKRVKSFSPVDPAELPSGFSMSARYVRLGEVASVSKGKTGIKDALPGPYPLVVTAESRSSSDHFDFEGPAVIIPTVSSTGHGDASLKRIHFQEGQYAVGSILAAVHPIDEAKTSAQFLFEYLSAFKDELLVSRMSGTANVSLTGTKIEEVPVPLVSKELQDQLTEVVSLCDALEAKGHLEAAQHAQLVQTLLGALTAGATPDELADNWQRVATHFDLLLDRPEAIDALEQTVLQLAVRGLLVPQDPKDEPASSLLQKIRVEKDRLIAGGKLKKDKLAEPLTRENGPAWLPSSWGWMSLSELHPEFQNGASSRGDAGGTMVTVLRLADIKNRRVSLADTREIPIAARDIEKYQVSNGDILITRVNGSAEIVGQFNLCDADYDAIYCDHFIRMRINGEWMDRMFLALLGESDLVRARIKDLFITTAGQKTVNQGHIGSLPLPLPPLAEQSRIVTRVESLRSLCADLRQRLVARQNTQAHLAKALIAEVA